MFLGLALRRCVPCRGGAPDTLTASISTYGGGIEKELFPLPAGKVEVRDYFTPTPSKL
jgi:hypothetical protein